MLFATAITATMAIWVIKLEIPSWPILRQSRPEGRKLARCREKDLGLRK